MSTKAGFAAISMILGLTLSGLTGCAEVGGAAGGAAAPANRAALDGRQFRIALVGERGGPAEVVDLAFAGGALDASDMQNQGFTQTIYDVQSDGTGHTFRGESRSPSAVRRFRGRVEGSRISGSVMLVPDGTTPRQYTFEGSESSKGSAPRT